MTTAPSTTPAPSTGSFEGLHDLRLIARQVKFEQLSFWLNPIGALFTLVFSVVFLVLLASLEGHQRISVYHLSYVQYLVPGFVAYGVMSSCYNILAITVVNRREMGLLKRIRLSPLPTPMLMAAIFINAMIIAAIGVVLMLVVGKVFYSVTGPAHPLAFVLTILVGMLSFTALGVGMSTLVPNADAAGPIVSLTYFLLVAFSGLYFAIPPNSGLAHFANVFPVRHLIVALTGTFNATPGSGPPWPWHDLLIMGIWGVGGAIVGLRRWSWSPKRG
jgi:ABC-2 type transport system permease protein